MIGANWRTERAGAVFQRFMAEKKKFQAIKGTRDLLPPETELWNRVEQTARDVFGTFGFGEIRPPIFEPTELFARSIGMDTDVVGKEMYSFEDRDETSVSLRPEATASVCRAYIEHGMHALPQPVKLYYMGPMFRRERPQKGRYRQFYQIGAEVLEMVPPNQDPAKNIGKDAAVDAEVIEMVMTFFARLGLDGVKLEINSIGDRECRPKYVELLRAELVKVKDKLGPDSQRRIETNPLRVLDSKLESEQGIIAGLPKIANHLCPNCAGQYAEVKRQLAMRGVAYAENWRLVRGLDYYMRTTFEITALGLGSQNAVCGGGRYDGLVELLGGPPTKATAIAAAQKLRAAGFRVELPPVEQKFGKALGQADKLGARYALILGDDEIATGQWTVKTLADGSQTKMSEAEFLEFLRKSKPLSS